MKSHLVHILPVWQACEILGEDVVRRVVSSLLHMRQNSAANRVLHKHNTPSGDNASDQDTYDLERDIDVLTRSLFYRHPPLHDKTAPLPTEVAHAWKRWLSARNLALDKSTLIHFVVPHTVQPHSGPAGHMGLFDCWVYALQGHATTSATTYYGGANNTLVWLPDVLILLAAAQQYQEFVGQHPLQQQKYSSSKRLLDLKMGDDDDDEEESGEDEGDEKEEEDESEEDGEEDEKSEEEEESGQSSSNSQSENDEDEEEGSDDDEEEESEEEEEEDDDNVQPRMPPRSPSSKAKATKDRWTPPEKGAAPTTFRKSAISEAAKAREEIDEIHREMVQQALAKNDSDDEGEGGRVTLKSPIAKAAKKRSIQSEGQEGVRVMALLAFRIYDSYQKKGSVARDTIHRFLTDVHGEDSFKETPNKTLLDGVFDDPSFAEGDLQATISEQQFVNRIVETFDYERRTHLLLDWLAMLLVAMVPPAEIPPSVTAYLDTMEHRPKPLCEVYSIAEGRLFEVKRRFHSLVQAGPSIIQGDPMGTDGASSEAGGSGSSQSSSAAPQAQQQQPKHTISQSAFLDEVCKPNTEMGSGGYLPYSLAELVFAAGAKNKMTGDQLPLIRNSIHGSLARSSGGGGIGVGNDDGESKIFWSLPNLIQFGCMAVRQHTSNSTDDQDMALLRFLFTVFSLTPQETSNDVNESIRLYDDVAPRVLTKDQVERMLLLMIEHTEFRLKAELPQDGSVDLDDNDYSNKSASNGKKKTSSKKKKSSKKKQPQQSEEEETEATVDLEPSYILGILPPKMERQPKQKLALVPLKMLLEYALESTEDGATMTFEEFCTWNSSSPDGGPASRLAPIMMDLRLIASVLFGVPPTLASMEITLIGEIERRHKARYPQTNVSRRGPRGTIWYIVEADWLRNWAQRVKDVAASDEDANDGRLEVKGGVRGLNRIENASLLTNSTLALRQDIQWKHDYEILPPLAWHALQAWYDGGPPIHRSVVRYIESNPSRVQSAHSSPHTVAKSRMPTENEIELYPYFVTVYLCDSTSKGEARPFQQNFQLSRVSPVGVMLVQLCKELDMDPSMARLWVLGSTPEGAAAPASLVGDDNDKDWILSLEQNIVDQRKARLDVSHQKKDIQLLLELKNRETNLWPRGEDGTEWSSRGKNLLSKSMQEDLGDGIVGLYNMGNTCFLNSSIQCISHTPIFREYFTSKAYMNDINTSNPLGHQGQLAQVSAVLINSLWKQFNQSNPQTRGTKRVTAPNSYVMVNAQSLTPKTFKDSLGKFNELFAGNEQHDAQELLTFLLAGLSEDLNRILEKPYIAAPDSDGRPDRELADIWWSNHLKRELSIVVALFNGQYKNLLTCRTCKYESARFEPFSTLTVPLPEDDSMTASIVLYPFSEGKEPTRYCVRVRASGNLNDVLLALAKELLDDEFPEEANTPPIEPQIEPDPSSNEEDPSEAEADEDDETETERIDDIDPRVIRKARDLAIVDMRDGYILRIAPKTWLLHDLQNKDTGDLPTMYAYELAETPDAFEEETTTASLLSTKEGEEENAGSEPSPEKPKSAYLAVAQRRSDLISRDYLHPLCHKLFGTPVLIRLGDIENCTGRRLYDSVAQRLRPLVPKAALRFLASETSESPASDAGDSEEKVSGYLTTSMTDSEEISAGPVPRYGFRLRITSREGRKCLLCPWYKCCVGCLIADDDALANVIDGDSITVDWHFAVDVATLGFGLRAGLLDPIAARPNAVGLRPPRPIGTVSVKTHSSCGIGGKGSQVGAITLEHCLEAFAKEDRIPDAYCSRCKEFRVQTTRMTLWRLPPILIIHLKRFQFTPTMRRKLRDLVVFPLEGLDLSRIMAPDGAQSEGINKVPSGDDDDATETTAETDTTGHVSSAGKSMLYDLYGVIHHQGALSGGHYVASLKSEIDGQWRLFNDAQIYEIHARDVIDASAYILFYMRRDVAKSRLADFWDLKQVSSISEEEMDNLVKGKADRCVIS